MHTDPPLLPQGRVRRNACVFSFYFPWVPQTTFTPLSRKALTIFRIGETAKFCNWPNPPIHGEKTDKIRKY